MLACDREFLKQYLTEKQNSHLQSGCFTGGGRLREGVALITYLNDICCVVLLNFDLSCVTRVCCLVFRHAHYRNRREELNMAVS